MIEILVVLVALIIIGGGFALHLRGYKSDDPEWYTATNAEGCKAHHQQLWKCSCLGNYCPVCKEGR